MRYFFFVAVSLISISIAGDLDVKFEADKFSTALYEHVLARNESIFDPELVLIGSNGFTLTRKQIIDDAFSKNETHALTLYDDYIRLGFTPEGLLNISSANETDHYTLAKSNPNIKGGWTLFKIFLGGK